MFGVFKKLSAANPSPKGVTVAQRKASTRQLPSFTDLLPWVDYEPSDQSFLLEDGISRAALFELTPTSTEGRSLGFLTGQREALKNAVNGSFPEYDDGEWVLQIFVQDDPELNSLAQEIRDYIDPEIRKTQFTQDYLERMDSHLSKVSVPEGLFVDTEVSGIRFRGQRRRIRAVIYRRYPKNYDFNRDGISVNEHLKNVSDRFESSIRQAGVGVKRCSGKDFYDWMLLWFNPNSPLVADTKENLKNVAPYPGDENVPFGRDYAEMLTLSTPVSDDENGLWYFDGLPHMALTFQSLRNKPSIGHFTAERMFDDGKFYTLFDKLPDGSVLSFTITIRAQDRLREHVALIDAAATGDSAEAVLTNENCVAVQRRMAKGDKLLPVNIVLYLRGADQADLRRKSNQVNAALLPSGIRFIDRHQDLIALDMYIRGLPMAFDPHFDLKSLKRSRLIFSSDVASLLPVYGRARGTGRLGMVYFNRGGEPLAFDPLSKYDRKKNGHMLILGPTGAGKSATCNKMLMEVMAVYRPRLFIVDAGNSFGLLGEHFRRCGVSVHQVTLLPDADVTLPPFADAYKMLEQIKRPELSVPDDDDDPFSPDLDDQEQIEDEKRDILGEMEIAARIMITGGDERENAKLTRADRFLIRRAIIEAARKAKSEGKEQVITEDVANMFHEISKDIHLPEIRRLRSMEMGDGMKLFCDGLAGKFFNRPGKHWPDADVTILEMGILAREGYEDQLTVAYLSFMNHVNALVEARQHEARQTIVLTDEAHIVTTNPLLAPYVIKITKMWRKLGTWLWLATQNMGDFPDAAKRMLNMMEWWICLTMPKEEVEQIKRFRTLNQETAQLLISTRKAPGKFTEGVVLTDHLEALFRNVPPALPLALAMTEKHEKAQRADIMRERGCSELDAAYIVAQQIENARG